MSLKPGESAVNENLAELLRQKCNEPKLHVMDITPSSGCVEIDLQLNHSEYSFTPLGTIIVLLGDGWSLPPGKSVFDFIHDIANAFPCDELRRRISKN